MKVHLADSILQSKKIFNAELGTSIKIEIQDPGVVYKISLCKRYDLLYIVISVSTSESRMMDLRTGLRIGEKGGQAASTIVHLAFQRNTHLIFAPNPKSHLQSFPVYNAVAQILHSIIYPSLPNMTRSPLRARPPP